MSSDIYFTGLDNGEAFQTEAYQAWQDGIAFSEITPELIHDLSQDIKNTNLEVFQTNIWEGEFFNNAAMLKEEPALLYDQNLLWHVGQQYGIDAISGILAHEVGHHIVNSVFNHSNIELSSWQNELCADYISGVVSGLSGLSPEGMHNFYAGDAWEPCDTHPAGGLRAEAFDKGIEWAANPSHQTFSEFLIQSPSELREMLQNDILNVFTSY